MGWTRLCAVVVAGLCVGACSFFFDADQFAAADDAACKAYGEPGTEPYAKCRKERDHPGACGACDRAGPVANDRAGAAPVATDHKPD
jgi:hypothetical protein